MKMPLDDQLAALDAFATNDDVALAGATRLRIRASLERGHAWRRHASLVAALAVLLVASASWALATGRLQRWLVPPRVLHSAVPTAVPLTDVPVAEPVLASVPAVAAVHDSSAAPAAPNELPRAATPASAPAPAPAPALMPAPAPAPARSEADPLYTRAHELHFHGSDPAAALAAWDAYLAAEPAGAFAVEARYNRALCLVRLGRLADARRELAPFAHGDIEPRGYRQPDATKLIERIDHHLAAGARPTNALNGSP